MGLSLASQEVTGLEPLATVSFPGHPQDALQQSQYLVVVPLPDACDLTWTKKGRSAKRTFFGSSILRDRRRWEEFEIEKIANWVKKFFKN
jgi:hypothetical protein